MNRKRAIFYILFDVVAALLVWLLFYLYRRITNDMVILGGNVEYYFVPDYSLFIILQVFTIQKFDTLVLSSYFPLS